MTWMRRTSTVVSVPARIERDHSRDGLVLDSHRHAMSCPDDPYTGGPGSSRWLRPGDSSSSGRLGPSGPETPIGHVQWRSGLPAFRPPNRRELVGDGRADSEAGQTRPVLPGSTTSAQRLRRWASSLSLCSIVRSTASNRSSDSVSISTGPLSSSGTSSAHSGVHRWAGR